MLIAWEEAGVTKVRQLCRDLCLQRDREEETHRYSQNRETKTHFRQLDHKNVLSYQQHKRQQKFSIPYSA